MTDHNTHPCVTLQGQPSYCIWGEGPSPFPGLGISVTTDIDKGGFQQVPWAPGPVGSPVTDDNMCVLRDTMEPGCVLRHGLVVVARTL